MPELGSKISLISKSDIRYEGRLFTVDPHECTIALAQVRSFGTEDRECTFPVAPQNEIYDYILFRGSDIKDIRVVNNPPLNDPAIVQLSVPPLAPSAYQNPGLSHAALSHLGQGGLGQYAGQAFASAYQSYGNLGGIPPGTNLAPGIGVPRGNPVTGVQKQLNQQLNSMNPVSASVLELIGGSRSSTATPVPGVTRKSPTIDQGVQVSSSRKDGGDGQQQQKKGQQWQQQQQQQHSGWEGKQSNWGQQQYQAPQPQRVQQRSGGQGGGWKGQSQGGGGGGGTGGGNTGAGAGGRRGRGRSGGGPSFSNRNQQQQSKNKNVLKFEGDYDFEQANEEFEELKSQLGKMKITSTGTTPTVSETTASTPAPVSSAVSPKVNGEDKKDDSGNETAIGEGEQEDESDVIFYDKSKSFFDNISCEAVERSKGHSQRTDWRQERKLNSETFGVASARRGGYRGRGYYGNRGMGNMFGRGGYRGYRGGQSNRGRGNFGGWGPSQQQMSNNTAAAGMSN
ncbi:hypothetical protein J437_LFUL002199 [Ladona fulva]|uniref:Uncharacterized protein n=1 Tax=Ladona fulva TaxID=123851 RepID=A0A8K0JUG5_LADFU|nr:hypothetical protein J437_LFUL002199 [Ladona fulva]